MCEWTYLNLKCQWNGQKKTSSEIAKDMERTGGPSPAAGIACLGTWGGWRENRSFLLLCKLKMVRLPFENWSTLYFTEKQNTEQNMSHLDLYTVPTRTQITSRIKIIFLAFVAGQIVLKIGWKLNASAVTTTLLCFLGWLSGVTSPGAAWTSLP